MRDSNQIVCYTGRSWDDPLILNFDVYGMQGSCDTCGEALNEDYECKNECLIVSLDNGMRVNADHTIDW